MSVASLQAQLDTAKKARDSGQITQAQYVEFHAKQSVLINEARAKDSPQPQMAKASAPVAEGYWQRTSEGPKAVSQAQAVPTASNLPAFTGPLPAENPVLIPTEGGGALVAQGYQVTKTETVTTPEGVAKSYTVAPVSQPKEYGVAAQFMGATKVGLDLMGLAAERQFGKDSVATQLAKAEINYGGGVLLSFAGGAMAAVEGEVYGVANLANSAKVSLESGRLQYKPFKEVVLAPTVSGSTVSLLAGGEEARAFNKMPFGYSFGAAFGEAGLFVLEGVGVGKATSYGVKTYTNLAPKVNMFAEKQLSKGIINLNTKVIGKAPGANKVYSLVVEPAYQKFNRVSTALDAADLRIGTFYKSSIVTPAKYKVANPIVQGAARAKAEVQTVGSRTGDLLTGGLKRVSPEAGMYTKAVFSPNKARLVSKEMASVGNRISKPLKASALAEEISFQRSVTFPRLQSYSNPLSKAVTNEFKMYGRVREGRKAFSTAQAESLNPVFGTKPTFPATKRVNVSPGGRGVKSTNKGLTVQGLQSTYKQSKKLDRIRGLSIEESSPLKYQGSISKQVTSQLTKTVTQQPIKMKGGFMISGGLRSSLAFPGTTQRVRVREEEETVYLVNPKEALGLHKPQLLSYKQSFASDVNRGLKVSPDTRGINQILRAEPIVRQPSTIKDSLKITPDYKPRFDTIVTPQDIQKLSFTPKQMFKTSQAQTPKMINPLSGVGGGSGGGRSFDVMRGRWAKRNTRIKSSSEMMGTVIGLKPSRQMQKSINKLGNMFTGDKKTRGKRKR